MSEDGGRGVQERVDALVGLQGGSPVEADLLGSPVEHRAVAGSLGANETFYVRLASGTEAFHKPFSGVEVSTAGAYGQDPEEPPLHECAAWRLAAALGAPYAELVAVCVLRIVEGEPGSLSRRVAGEGHTQEPMRRAVEQARAAAFWDALVGQQDRHLGNLRWDGQRLGLIDHGFAFARPGDLLNSSAFLGWRHAQDAAALSEHEHAALERLVASNDLHGMARVLATARTDALATRADRMLATGTLTKMGEF